jgi:hypothetical protein
MKIPNNLNLFHGLFLAVMSLFLSFNITNAQNSVSPGVPTSLINGFTIKTAIKVVKGDSVIYWYRYSADTTFGSSSDLIRKIITRDTVIYDTFTVSKDFLPPTDSTGYGMYIKAGKIFVKAKDTGFVKPSQYVIVYPTPFKVKIQNLKIDSLPGGCTVNFFGKSGSPYEKGTTTFKFRYNPTDIWRKPNPDTVSFKGNMNVSRTITGMTSNKYIELWINTKNVLSSFDTIVKFHTTVSSNKPAVAEAAGKSATFDSAFIVFGATSFNRLSKFYCVNTSNNDTQFISIASNKMETLIFRFGNLSGNTKYSFKCWGNNDIGIGNTIIITVATQPKLVTPKFTALKPEVYWDYTNLTYYILPKIDWITNSNTKIKRIDVRVYDDSLYNSTPTVFKIGDANSALNGPFTGPQMNSDSGRFWYDFVIETTDPINSIVYSSLIGYNVGWAYVPHNPAGITELQKTVNNIPCPIQDGNIQIGLQEESELVIMDGSGKPVIQNHMEAGNNSVDLSTLKDGNYYLMVSDKKGTATRKIQIK